MLYDLRTYRCRPGTVAEQLQLYAETGYDTQCKHLGVPLFYGVVETGDVNAYVHIWHYENAADREARRTALYHDQVWRTYHAKGAELGYQIAQENSLLVPAGFWQGPETRR